MSVQGYVLMLRFNGSVWWWAIDVTIQNQSSSCFARIKWRFFSHLTSKNVISGFPLDFLARASPNHWNIRFPGFHPYPVSKFGNKLKIPKDASVKRKGYTVPNSESFKT